MRGVLGGFFPAVAEEVIQGLPARFSGSLAKQPLFWIARL
jgi:hypothetical protein